MMEIKDLFGLSQPLTKLVEVVSSGVGRLSRSYFYMRDADAKAYEIRKLTEALNDSRKLLGTVSYDNEGLSVSFDDKQALLPADNSLQERSLARATYQEARRQLNVENITQHAAEELSDKETVSEEKVDEDWIARFFKIAEDISAEDMQVLWGKVLAGEIARPKSYSLRTLDTLKNLTRTEAEIFAKAAQAALGVSGGALIFNPDPKNCEYLKSEFGLNFAELLFLREAGLVQPTDLMFPLKANAKTIFTYGSKCVIIEKLEGVPEKSLPVDVFTRAGFELLPLVDVSIKMSYIQKIASFLKTDGIHVKHANLVYHDEESIKYKNEQEALPQPDADSPSA
jgi:hypothetical protein